MGKRRSEIGNLVENPQVFVCRERRRRNCLTETTRTRCRFAASIKSTSRLRSSSLVTRYRALPRIAASKIASSSGSRHILISPRTRTTFARAAMSRTNVSASWRGYTNRRIKRGRFRTSAISISWEREVTTVKRSRRQASTTCPGGPVGFRKAETQTLVSSRATSGTMLRLHLGPRLSHFRLDNPLWNRFRSVLDPAKQSFELAPPPQLWTQGNQDAGFLFQPERSQWSQHAVFKNRFNRFFHRICSLRQCHERIIAIAPHVGQQRRS